MRLMSFSMTTEAYRDESKTVTRRLGWWNLKVGDVLMGVEKCQGIPKGGHVVRMHPLRVLATIREPLFHIGLPSLYGAGETAREGFPGMDPAEFIAMFCKANGCGPGVEVNRIEFEHLPTEEVGG